MRWSSPAAVALAWYSVDNGANQSFSASTQNLTVELASLTDGAHNVRVYSNDSAGNLASSIVYFTIDTKPPATVKFLAEIEVGPTHVFWTWTNPSVDFNHTIIYIDGAFAANTSDNFYNATGLSSGVTHTISVMTVDPYGNVNTTWVNDTATTADIVPPGINITSPLNATYEYGSQINLTYGANETIIDDYYVLDGGANTAFVNGTTQITPAVGSHNITIWARDAASNWGNDTEYFTVADTKPPRVENASAPNIDYGQNQVVRVDVYDLSGVSSVRVEYDGSVNYTMQLQSGSTYNATITMPAIGVHSLRFYANDTYGNLNSTVTASFSVGDTTPPTVAFIDPTPANNANLSATSIIVNVSHVELNPHTLILSWNGVNESRSYSGTFTNITKAVSDGTYTFYVWVNDTSGNSNQTATRIIKVDTVPPTIAVGSPANTTYATKIIALNASASEAVSNWMYSLNGAANVTFTPNTTITAAEGANSIAVYANDSAGNLNSSKVYFTVDTTPPAITITSPQSTTYSTNSVGLNFTVSDAGGVSWTGFSLDGAANVTITGNTTLTGLANGLHNLVLYANDSLGNLASASVSFSVNVVYITPVVTVLSPLNKTYTANSVGLDFTVTDEGLILWTGYSLDGAANVTSGNTTLIGLTEGQHSVRVFARDNDNLVGSAAVYFSVDTIKPTITIASPLNTTYNVSWVALNYSVSEFASWVAYSLDGAANVTLTQNTTLVGLASGVRSLTIYANDTVGNMNYTKVLFTINDTQAPAITLASPKNDTYANNATVQLAFTFDESASWIGYSLDGAANVTITGNITLPTLSTGSHSIVLYANDSSNNLASSTVYFTADPNAPMVITITSPQNTTYLTNFLSINYTLSEVASWVGYTLDGAANVTLLGNTSITVVGLGQHRLTIYANDTLGNMNSSTVYFTLTDILHGVELMIDSAGKTAEIKETVNYTLTVKNTGTSLDIINLTVDYTSTDTAALSAYSVTLSSGEARNVTLSVVDAQAGSYFTAVKATSTGDISKSSIAYATTTFVYPFDLTVDVQQQTITQNDTANYTMTIKNTGTKSHTFNISYTSTAGANVSLNTTPATLAAGASITRVLGVRGTAGQVYYVTVTATDLADQSITKSLTTYTVVKEEMAYGVSLSVIGNASLTVGVNKNATYVIRIKNIGNANDIFDVYVSQSYADNATLNASIVSIPKGASADVVLNVSDSTRGTYTVVVTARSRSDGTKYESILTSTTVKEGYALAMSAAPLEQTIYANETAVYTITIENLGSNNDTYSLGIQNLSGADTAILSNYSVFVEAGKSMGITLRVNSSAGGIYLVAVNASSSGDASKRAEVVTKTRIVGTPVYAVDMSADKTSAIVEKNTNATYTITIRNTGNQNDTYTLEVSGTTSRWSFDTSLVSLGAGESTTRELRMAESSAGVFDLLITAKSKNSTASDAVRVTATVITTVDLSIDVTEQTVNTNETAVYFLTVKNIGNKVHDINLTYENLSGNHLTWKFPLSGEKTYTVSSLGSGESRIVALEINSSIQGVHQGIVKASTDVDSDSVFLTTRITTAPVYAVQLSPDVASKTVDPGKSVTYVITIKNTGNQNDAYQVFIAESGMDNTSLDRTTMGLTAGQSNVTRLTVSDDTPGEYYVSVAVRSSNSSAYTTVKTVVKGYGVQISADTGSQTVMTNESAVYVLTVKNTGNVQDTYSLSVSSNADIAILSTNLVTIEAGSSATLIFITANSSEGITTATITAVSQSDPSKKASISLRTTTLSVPVYGVSARVDEPVKTTEVNTPVNYSITIKNTGNRPDNIALSKVATSDKAEFNTTQIYLLPGESVIRTLTVEDSTPGGYYAIITASSKNDTSKSASVSVYTSVIRSVSLKVDASTRIISEGGTANYTLTLKNTGSVEHQYNLSSTAILGSPTVIFTPSNSSSYSVTLSPGESVAIPVSVTAPMGEHYSVITASSGNDKDTVTISTIVTAAKVYGVAISVDSATKAVGVNQNATYVLTVRNTGNDADNITLTAENTLVDYVELSASTVTLQPGESATVLLRLRDASPGVYDVKIITISQGDSSKTASVTTTTTVKGYKVSIKADSTRRTILTNESAAYALTITNEGNVRETFEITASNLNGANISVLDRNSITLDSGASGSATYTLAASQPGNYNTRVVARSTSDPSKNASITLITEITPQAVYGVALSIAEATQTVEIDTAALYTVTILNTGNKNDTFALSATSTADSASLETSSVTISGGDSRTVWLRVKDSSPGTYFTAVTASGAKTASAVATTEAVYPLTLKVDPLAKATNASEGAIYTLTVKNTGTIPHTFNITVSNSTIAVLDRSSVSLQSGEEGTVRMNVTAPPGVHIVTATARDPVSGASATANTTTLVTQGIVYGVRLSVDATSKTIQNTTNATYVLTVESLSNVNGTFNLTLNNIDGASTSSIVGETQFTLLPKGTATRIVKVGDPRPGEYRINITARSLNDTAVWDSVDITTVVLDECGNNNVDEDSVIRNNVILCNATVINSTLEEVSAVYHSTVNNSKVEQKSLVKFSKVQLGSVIGETSRVISSTITSSEIKQTTDIVNSTIISSLIKQSNVIKNSTVVNTTTQPNTHILNAVVENGKVTGSIIIINGLNLNVSNGTNISDITVDVDANSKNLAGIKGQVRDVTAGNSRAGVSINASKDYVGASLAIRRSRILPKGIANMSDNIEGYVSIEPSDNLNNSLALTTIKICYDPALVLSRNISQFGLVYFNGSDWEVVNGSKPNPYTNCVEGNGTHFSVYGIDGKVYATTKVTTTTAQPAPSGAAGGGGAAAPEKEPTCYDKIVGRFNLTITPKEIVERPQPIAFKFECKECANLDREVTRFEYRFDNALLKQIQKAPFEIGTSDLSLGNHSLYYKIELTDYPPIECTRPITVVEQGYLARSMELEQNKTRLIQKVEAVNWSAVNESLKGIQALVAPRNISVKPMEIESTLENIRMKPGDSRMFFLTASNNLEDAMTCKAEVFGQAAAFAKLDDKPYTLEPMEKHTWDIPVSVPSDAQPGVYTGLIRVYGVGVEVLPITITVIPPEKPIIDVRTEVLTESLYDERILEFKANIYNIGGAEATDIALHYAVLDAETEQIIAHDMKELTLYAALTHVERIKLDEVPPPGKYLLEALVEYEGGSVSAVSSFEVARPLPWRFFAGVFTIIALIAAGLRTQQILEERRKERAKYVLPLSVAKLPGAEPQNAFIGKVADVGARAYLNLNDLTTHLFVSGGTGFGKSVAAMVIAEEALAREKSVIVVDPTLQWTGFLKACGDASMLESYAGFGMKKEDARLFKGNYVEIRDPNHSIDVEEFMKPGEITILGASELDSAGFDGFVSNVVQAFFKGRREEHKELKCLMVFENGHLLLPRYGGKTAYTQIEKCFREFRKWGIGVVLVSQMVSGFSGGVLGNVGMEIQMKTNLEADIGRIRKKYGDKYAQALVKQTKGVGMLHSAKYNEGQPYFVHFRPLLHSPLKLSDAELAQRREQVALQRKFERIIAEMKRRNIDTYELELELKLGINKMKQGFASLAKVYIDSLSEKIRKRIGDEEFKKYMEGEESGK